MVNSLYVFFFTCEVPIRRSISPNHEMYLSLADIDMFLYPSVSLFESHALCGLVLGVRPLPWPPAALSAVVQLLFQEHHHHNREALWPQQLLLRNHFLPPWGRSQQQHTLTQFEPMTDLFQGILMTKKELENKQHIEITLPDNSPGNLAFKNCFISASGWRQPNNNERFYVLVIYANRGFKCIHCYLFPVFSGL